MQRIYELHLRKIAEADASGTTGEARAPDKAVFSRHAVELQIARNAIANLPAVREQNVLDARRSIEAGLYRAADDELAESILNCVTYGRGN